MHDFIVCPNCKCNLQWNNGIKCLRCGQKFDIIADIPVLLPPNADSHKLASAIDHWMVRYTDRMHIRSLIKHRYKYYEHFSAYFKEYSDLFNGRILQIGANLGSLCKLLKNANHRLELFAVDISLEAAKLAKKFSQTERNTNVYLVADFEVLPFPDDFFDCVVGSSVLTHLTDEQRFGREIRRVLKPGGHYIGINERAMEKNLHNLYNRIFRTDVYKKQEIPFNVLTFGAYRRLFEMNFSSVEMTVCRHRAYYLSSLQPAVRLYFAAAATLPSYILERTACNFHIIARKSQNE